MIRVAFVLPSFAGGGAERVMITIANALDRASFAARLIVLDGTGPLAGLVAPHVPVTALHRARLRAALPALRRALLAEPTDVALSTIGYLNVGLLLLKPVLPRSLRLVVRESNMPLSGTRGLVRIMMRCAMRLLYRNAHLVLSPAHRVGRELTGGYRVPSARLCVIPNPVDADLLRRKADPARRHPGQGLRLIAAGRLVEQKGYSRLLQLLTALPPTTHLTILGDGPLRGLLADQISALGLECAVELAGFLDNPWPHYAGADAFLLPSLWEGMPNAALEALAVGTPVIATPEAGGMSEVVDTAPAGAVTISPADGAFVAAILRLTPRGEHGVRPSLLPDAFALEQVRRRYEAELGRVAGRALAEPGAAAADSDRSHQR